MDSTILDIIHQQNPWLKNPQQAIIVDGQYIERKQTSFLLQADWDSIWTLLIGPRQAGKTTLGLHLAQQLITAGRYQQLLYLNCDYWEIRSWLNVPTFLAEAEQNLGIKNYIL